MIARCHSLPRRRSWEPLGATQIAPKAKAPPTHRDAPKSPNLDYLQTILHHPQVECTQELRRDLVIVTAGTSAMATFLVGVGANLPFALAPGMGLNAYFTYYYNTK